MKKINNPNDLVIVSTVRTPFGRFGGVLKEIHSSALGTLVIKEVLSRTELDGNAIDELYYGMCIQSEAALLYNVIGRQALIHAGLSPETVSLTIDRACCSSLTAIQLGRKSILLDEASICMAVGAENMSNTPIVINGHRWGTHLEKPILVDHLNPIMYVGFKSIAADAGQIALEYNVTREMQDEWAFNSQMKYQHAKKTGKFMIGEELIAVPIPSKKGDDLILEEDEFPKPNSTLEKLAKLKPVYESPTVTAGNSPGLDSGAAAIIITKRSTAESLGLNPLGIILSVGSIAREPHLVAEVPAYAIQQALDRAGLSLDDLNLFEINEAFAAVPLVSTKILAKNDSTKWEKIKAITNPNGGAIAIGHPVGASGARLLMTAMYELRRRGGGIGVVGICGGLAQGDAVVIKVDETCTPQRLF